MKNITLKNLLFAVVAVAGFNVLTSCDGCSRKGQDLDRTNSTVDANQNENTIDGASSSDYGTVNSSGTGTSSSGNSNGSATGTSASGGTSTSSENANSGLTEQEITDRVENSSSNVGKPVNGGGTAGTGMGTGTGSTGNNSRVTTREDQKRH